MSATPQTSPASRSGSLAEFAAIGYRLSAAVAVAVVLTLLCAPFLTSQNLVNVLRQASLMVLLASGLTLVILAGGLDLSVGANVGLSACLAAIVLKSTGSSLLGGLVGVGCGATIGLANGVLVTLLRMPPFIATYGMLWVLHGVTYSVMAGTTIYGFPPAFRSLGIGYALGIPVPVFLMVVFLVIGGFFTRRTTYGQEVYAIGANREAARLSGVPITRRLILVYVLSGAMAGLASLVFLARLNSVEGDIGETLTLPAIAAALIGGASLFGGVGTLFGTFTGALILTLVMNGMNLMTISTNWQPLVTGAIVILAVFMDVVARRRAEVRS